MNTEIATEVTATTVFQSACTPGPTIGSLKKDDGRTECDLDLQKLSNTLLFDLTKKTTNSVLFSVTTTVIAFDCFH